MVGGVLKVAEVVVNALVEVVVVVVRMEVVVLSIDSSFLICPPLQKYRSLSNATVSQHR